jgi:hypothetical protein
MSLTIRIRSKNNKRQLTIKTIQSHYKLIQVARRKGLTGKLVIELFGKVDNKENIFSAYVVNCNNKVTTAIFPHAF